MIRITEELLREANRQQLLQKSKTARNYKNTSKGKNRYDRRTKSKISATVRDYNSIQMDTLFKRDILRFRIPVLGETDVYIVEVIVNGLLAEVQKQVVNNKGILEFKVILQSLMKVLNTGDVYISCSCPDYTYRQRYWATQDGYVAGYHENRPSNITNPNDDLGGGCKHVMLILANLDWCVKVASVINNYIKYAQVHFERMYADFMFPKIYGVKYDKAVQLSLFDTGLLPDDQKTMDTVIGKNDKGMLTGRNAKGKFVKDNPYTFKKKEKEPLSPEDDPNQLKLDFKFGDEKNKELAPNDNENNLLN